MCDCIPILRGTKPFLKWCVQRIYFNSEVERSSDLFTLSSSIVTVWKCRLGNWNSLECRKCKRSSWSKQVYTFLQTGNEGSFLVPSQSWNEFPSQVPVVREERAPNGPVEFAIRLERVVTLTLHLHILMKYFAG